MKYLNEYRGETRASNCGGDSAPCIVRPISSESKMNDRPRERASSSTDLDLDEDLIDAAVELLIKYC